MIYCDILNGIDKNIIFNGNAAYKVVTNFYLI